MWTQISNSASQAFLHSANPAPGIVASFQWAQLAASSVTDLSSLLPHPQQEDPPTQREAPLPALKVPSTRELDPRSLETSCQVSTHLLHEVLLLR